MTGCSQGHGKVILFGEHGVVHGGAAIAAGVEAGARVYHHTCAGPTRLSVEPWNVQVALDGSGSDASARTPLGDALRAARALYQDDLELSLCAQVRLPGAAGMGSSAALGVAVLRAMDAARALKREDDSLIERSLVWERVFHGNPSGLDNTMAVLGGLAHYRKGQPLEPLGSPVKLRLVVGDSREPSSTREMVANVARQYAREPGRVGKIFEGMEAIVQNARRALSTGDLRAVGQLMTLNQALLNALMLSTTRLEEMIRAALDAGALGAKLTGAGGGGCMVAVVDSERVGAEVRLALAGLDAGVYDVELGG